MAVFLASSSSVSIAGNPTPTAVDRPTNAGTSATAESLRAKNAALIEKVARDQDATHKRGLALLDSSEKDVARHEQDLTRVENGITRQEQDMARFEKILGTWEHQQAQYQKYLDSLPTSKTGK